MKSEITGFLPLAVMALCAVPHAGFAQQPVDAGQLARVRSLLQSSRAELSQEQYSLLSGKLALAEQAQAELTALAEAAGGAAAAAEATGVVATGGRALIGGAAELLPLLIAIWPSTAHAPGIKEEKPQVRAARTKLDEKLKELAQAAQQVDGERKAKRERKPRGKSAGVSVSEKDSSRDSRRLKTRPSVSDSATGRRGRRLKESASDASHPAP